MFLIRHRFAVIPLTLLFAPVDEPAAASPAYGKDRTRRKSVFLFRRAYALNSPNPEEPPTNSNIQNPNQAGFFAPVNTYQAYPSFVHPNAMHNFSQAHMPPSPFRPFGQMNVTHNVMPAFTTPVPNPPNVAFDYEALRRAIYPYGPPPPALFTVASGASGSGTRLTSTNQQHLSGNSVMQPFHRASSSRNIPSIATSISNMSLNTAIDPDEYRRERRRLQQQARRQNQTSTAQMERLDNDAAAKRRRRDAETPEQSAARRTEDAALHARAVLNETPEETRMRQSRNAASQAQARLNENSEQRRARQEEDAAARRAARADESSDEEASRRARAAEYQRERRQNMTPSQRERWRERNRNNYQRRVDARMNGLLHTAMQDVLPELHSLGPMSVECSSCKALYFAGECAVSDTGTFDRCCNHGRVSVPLYDDYPDLLKELLSRNHPNSSNFHDNIRQFNSSLAMASMDSQLKTPPGRGPFVFCVHGSINHNIGPAIPANPTSTSYGQLYFMDTAQAAEERIGRRSNSKCSPALLRSLSLQMSTDNVLARSYKLMGDVFREEEAKSISTRTPLPNIKMVFFNDKFKDQRTYNTASANEVAVVFVGPEGSVPSPREYTTFLRGGGFTKLSVTNPKLDPMTYPIFWPKGTDSWHPNLVKRGANGLRRTRVTQANYYSFLLSFRRAFNPIHLSGKLFQQFAVDVWVRIEYNDLQYIRHNQGNLRAESYQQLQDFVVDGSGGLAGTRIVLPSSHVGSPRYQTQSYQDAMTIVSKFGKPDYFLTFTTNPKWKEITDNLLPGQSASDRPDIVTRVFNQKWSALMDDLVKKRILGKIPDPAQQPVLYELVKKHMLHRRCGTNDLLAPCLKDGVCTKKFPKNFSDTTTMDGHSYPQYRRRNNGIEITIGNGPNTESYTNQHVVPFNKWILVKFDCHVNLEVCCLTHSCKYLFKYVHKGSDKASVQLRREIRAANGFVDEIEEHLDGRYLCPPEALHRIFKYEMQDKSHSIDRLQVHLPEGQRVTFAPGQERVALNQVQHQKTTLVAFFDLNQLWHEKEQRGEDLGPTDPRTLLYTELPNYFVFHKDAGNYHWAPRTQGGSKKIGRLMGVPVVEKERFALRQLLLKTKGPKSFEDLRQFNGHTFASFEGSAKARGLLHDADAFNATMSEAVLSEMPFKLRQLFASLFLFFMPHADRARELWELYVDDLAEDYARGGRRTALESHALAWYDVSDCLSVQNIELDQFIPPPLPQRPLTFITDSNVNHAEIAAEMRRNLNPEQLHAVTEIENGVKLAFVDGPGGCGKTYLYEYLYHTMKAQGKNVVCCAWTGIAASLLPEGRTLSSLFRLNKNDDNRSSSIKPNSKDGRYLRDLDVIIVDEVSMVSSWTFDALNTALMDVMNTTEPFGGKVVLLGGDFRQVLPIPPKNSGIDPYQICIKQSSQFSLFAKFKLSTNMRASEASNEWKQFLMSIGNGSAPVDESGFVKLPQEIISTGDLIEDVYGGCFDDPNHLQSRAILCPLNRRVDVINNDILDEMTGEERTYYSNDEVEKEGDGDQLEIDPEFLHSQTPRGFPLHLLRLKIGSVIMLLRNLNIRFGMCNGTRFQVKKFARNYIQAAFISGPRKGETVLIPRIELVSDDKSLSFKLRRRQFPVRLAFVMTINKAQGQSLERVGIDLETEVFGHGQLYVALSRSKTMEGVKVYTNDRQAKAKNVVDACVIEDSGN